jgi:septal ring factor EnvC (AmiA/AmiB activator)
MATQKSDSTSADLHTDDVASFLDLKTEFIRRRDAALTNKRNYDGISQNSTNILHKNVKTNILAISKEEKRTKNELSAQRTQRIRQNEELLRKEEQQRVNQRKILENKAAIYERMSRGEKLVYEDGKEAEFLVNFEVKKRELEAKGCGSVQNSRTVAEDDLTDEELRRSDDEREGR